MAIEIVSLGEYVYDDCHLSGQDSRDILDLLVPQINELLKDLSKNPPVLTSEDIAEVLVQDEEMIFVAAAVDNTDPENPKLVGMASIFIYQKFMRKTGLVEDVVVKEDYQGQRLGQRLMEKLIEVAKERGVEVIELTSNPKRVAAQALYLKLGFKKRETDAFQLKL